MRPRKLRGPSGCEAFLPLVILKLIITKTNEIMTGICMFKIYKQKTKASSKPMPLHKHY